MVCWNSKSDFTFFACNFRRIFFTILNCSNNLSTKVSISYSYFIRIAIFTKVIYFIWKTFTGDRILKSMRNTLKTFIEIKTILTFFTFCCKCFINLTIINGSRHTLFLWTNIKSFITNFTKKFDIISSRY